MSNGTTVTPLATYRNERPYPFCPGCGHGPILDQLNAALVERAVDPRRVVLVSDIGCSGLSDQYFATSAFHGLHGRSITYATGLKLARPELEVVVLMGDGGAGIGGAHLLAAARRNVGITVLVLNNLNFGMTGGQHSPTTPPGAITATTPLGQLEAPLDLCATVAANGAAFAWRGTSFAPDLAARIGQAMAHPGFALLDVWGLCSAHFLPRNRWSRKSLEAAMNELGFARGIVRRHAVEDYGERYRRQGAPLRGEPVLARCALEPDFACGLDRRFELVVAGAAGGRVGTAARLVARGAILSGLHAAVRGDYPVTVRSGCSLAELVLSPEPIDWTGIDAPDALIIVNRVGLLARCGRYLADMTAAGRVFVDLSSTVGETAAAVVELDLAAASGRLREEALALVSLAAVGEGLGLFPHEALAAALAGEPEPRRPALAAAIAAGRELATEIKRRT